MLRMLLGTEDDEPFQLEDPLRAATARATPVVATAVLEVVAAAVAVAVAEAHPMVPAAIAKATRIATPPQLMWQLRRLP
jgi:hypothetical protein